MWRGSEKIIMEKRRGLKNQKGSRRRYIVIFLMLLFVLLLSVTALADGTGWKRKGKKVYYYQTTETGEKKAVGLVKIEKKYYYFSKSGVMQTGWVSTEDGFRYFSPKGSVGSALGAMYTGFKTIGKYHYHFDKKGVVSTGLTVLKKNTYYFNTGKKLGVRGRAITSKWKTIKGKQYYFNEKGALAKNCWVQKKWYVDENGEILKNTVTPDGYLVGSDGVKAGTSKVKGWVKINGKYHYYDSAKKKLLTSCWRKVSGNYYYLDADGVRVTGWQNIGKYRYHFTSKGVKQTGLQTIKGKMYYFDEKGRLQKNTTINGYVIDAKGVVTKVPEEAKSKKKILIISGHGQGDAGATSKWGYESNYTRQFGKLIYEELKSSGKVDVDYYKNGSINYDCYQQNAKTLGSTGLNIGSQISGRGTVKSKVISGIATNSNIPDFTKYDYVLEIHFNAKGSGKDPDGDGRYTGVGFYINSYKSKTTLEKKILSAIVGLGFRQWGSGVYTSSTLFNARICQELGVSYGLLETAFIDDGDDMKFYTANKSKMAKAVANQISAYFG